MTICLVATSWSLSYAQSTPEIGQLQQIFEYLDNGTRPLIYQVVTTTNIVEKMPENETVAFKPEERIYIWMRAAVPANIGIDDYYTVSIDRTLPNGNIQNMKSKAISFSSGSRGVITYRTWTYWSAKYFRPGEYTVNLLYMGEVEASQTIFINASLD
jgi:hypothetical protein